MSAHITRSTKGNIHIYHILGWIGAEMTLELICMCLICDKETIRPSDDNCTDMLAHLVAEVAAAHVHDGFRHVAAGALLAELGASV